MQYLKVKRSSAAMCFFWQPNNWKKKKEYHMYDLQVLHCYFLVSIKFQISIFNDWLLFLSRYLLWRTSGSFNMHMRKSLVNQQAFVWEIDEQNVPKKWKTEKKWKSLNKSIRITIEFVSEASLHAKCYSSGKTDS